jgi:phage terminase large subunit
MVAQALSIQAAPTYETGIVYLVNKLMLPRYRTIAHEGGTRSGKTYNNVITCIDEALATPNLQVTIASRDMPHLRKGAMKDFTEIMLKRGLWEDDNWYETTHTYTFANGSYIEFMGADDLGKVSGPGRDILFCNEVNFFKYIVFRQLAIRTRKKIIVDYNPIHPKHWVYDKILTRKNCYMWQSTYLDNLKFLPKEQIEEIQGMAETDPEWARIYVQGLRGTLQKGQIYKNWKPISINEYRKIEAPEIFGVDWGYYPDPNAVTAMKSIGDERYVRKILYKRNMSDESFVSELKAIGCTATNIFIAPTDSGGSKAINYMQNNGFPYTYPIKKPPGSVNIGIKALRTKKVYYVMDNELDFEVGNYTYLLDPNEEETNTPVDKHNHLLDATRYIELYKPYL